MRIPPPNYTQTPNDLFDHWLPLLGEAELKVLLVIMRKTFGWHKTHDAISVSQLARHTGMLEETVINATKSLQSKGVITREVIGPNGKQQTIYSLVVVEDSNNSYPSVEPRGPLGSDPPVQTEAQKKLLLKETLQKKQQQEDRNAAAFSKHVKEEENLPNIHPLLEKVDIPISDKVEITQMYSTERIQHALLWIERNEKPLTRGLAAALKWACKTLPELPVNKKEIAQKLKEDDEQKISYRLQNENYAKQYDFVREGSKKISVGIDIVSIHDRECNSCIFALGFTENGFMEQFTNALRKNNFKILEKP